MIKLVESFGSDSWQCTTGWVKISLFWLFWSLFVHFFSHYPIPLYKRRKMTGQSPLKVPSGLRYLSFHFREEFWKKSTFGWTIYGERLINWPWNRGEVQNIYYNLFSYWKLIKRFKNYVKKDSTITTTLTQIYCFAHWRSVEYCLKLMYNTCKLVAYILL